jgi:hypothetical protein
MECVSTDDGDIDINNQADEDEDDELPRIVPGDQAHVSRSGVRGDLRHPRSHLELEETCDTPAATAADLTILGCFFAMRSCENAAAPKPGLTKTVDVIGLVFLDKDHSKTPQDHLGIALPVCVTFLFLADQKNRDKNAQHTQKRMDHDPVLCPVWRAASSIGRICCLVFGFLGSTTINFCAHQTTSQGLVTLQLASGFLRGQLRNTCATLGGKPVFGFNKNKICPVGCRHGLVPGKPLHQEDHVDGP